MNWIIPPLWEEIGEFERVADTFDIELSSLISLLPKGVIEYMDEETWSELGNTDSWETTKIEQVLETADQYGRDARKLLVAFEENRPMQVPIVLFLADGHTHLVSGNTRLMVCRAIGERPKIFKLQMI